MQQYFVNNELCLNAPIELNKEQSFHIQKVLRMNESSVIRLANNKTLMLAHIQYDQSKVLAIPYQELENESEFPCNVTIVQAFIKGDRWDYVIQKSAELGCLKFVPLVTSRTIVKTNEKVEQKLQRWNKIALEASEQSRRFHNMEVLKPIAIKELTKVLSDVNLVAYEKSDIHSTAIQDCVEKGKDITLIIGPEGGFSIEEVEYMESIGIKPCSLGKRILRAETATLYALSVLDIVIG